MIEKPQKYDMNKQADINRWFEEMASYLRTSDFVNDGTDFEGREFAMDGFWQLQKKLVRSLK